MRYKYTLREIIQSYPKEKNKTDGILDHLLYRPISYPLTWLMLNLQIQPNSISYFSIVVCFTGLVLSFGNTPIFRFCGILCFFLFAVLDCVDGNMARTMNLKNIKRVNARFGSCVDSIAGYCAYTAIILSMGIASQKSYSTPYFPPFYAAAFASSANLLMRTILQAYKLATGVDTKTAAGKEKRLSEEIGITGFMPLLYLAGYIFKFLPYIVYAYALIYCGGCIITIIKLIHKIERKPLN